MRLHENKARAEGHEAPAPSPAGSFADHAALVAQRKASPEAVVELQRTVGNDAVTQLLGDEGTAGTTSPVLEVVGRGGGEPLDSGTRGRMEQTFGTDLSNVRVHTGIKAAASATAVQARAYTVGEEIVFGPGQYQPGSASGQRTLAHELTHVVQQRNGPVSGTPTGDGISVSHPSDTFEQAAEANAERVMSSGRGEPEAGGPGASPAQREAAPEEEKEEEPVQGAWAQREAAPEEEEDETAKS